MEEACQHDAQLVQPAGSGHQLSQHEAPHEWRLRHGSWVAGSDIASCEHEARTAAVRHPGWRIGCTRRTSCTEFDELQSFEFGILCMGNCGGPGAAIGSAAAEWPGTGYAL